MSNLEDRFQRLQSLEGIRALINQTEDLYLDCKEWPSREDDTQKILAKAVSGFANADGGLLLIGVEAKSKEKDQPDVITCLKPVPDALAVKSRIENLIGNLIEPPLPGVQVAHVLDDPAQKPGYVVVHIPPTDGLPIRSRKHWNFFIRISAGTFPMEYFQLADMFGRRNRPVLSLGFSLGGIRSQVGAAFYEREFSIGIQNSGRGIARFPSVRFRVKPGINLAPNGLNGNGDWGLPKRPTREGWILFGGGADDVVYPGTDLSVAKLTHRSRASSWPRAGRGPDQIFVEEIFEAEVAAEGFPYQAASFVLPEDEFAQGR